MADGHYNILFICTGNSARSIVAEAIMNDAGRARGFKAFSAGSHPRGAVQAMALRTLAEHGYPTEGYRSKSWNEFAGPEAPHMDFVFTVCDQAAGEVCPLWPGKPMTARWGVPDPAATQGSEEAIVRAYRDAFIVLKRRIDLLIALPLNSLEQLALQREIDHIGTVR